EEPIPRHGPVPGAALGRRPSPARDVPCRRASAPASGRLGGKGRGADLRQLGARGPRVPRRVPGRPRRGVRADAGTTRASGNHGRSGGRRTDGDRIARRGENGGLPPGDRGRDRARGHDDRGAVADQQAARRRGTAVPPEAGRTRGVGDRAGRGRPGPRRAVGRPGAGAEDPARGAGRVPGVRDPRLGPGPGDLLPAPAPPTAASHSHSAARGRRRGGGRASAARGSGVPQRAVRLDRLQAGRRPAADGRGRGVGGRTAADRRPAV
ncbi:MAG: hypothetical protein AVDCRST_MAG64-2658, partial [uncultured Phycisphaerae bacterium]